ncbi:ferritin-like domain-containing protein [Croceibacter atlanticus]|uniref:ferritin-like domain-containing protein n=1 Tax=Croceibacter atlanticus TaxID=313588 RepID=UPI0024911037|nr:PA2169 family four-helix-bundle protein [Croceibacter atlanticus]
MDKKEISNSIQEIIEKNNDSYKGYKQVADKANDSQLRSFFIQQATERKEFAGKLLNQLKIYNPDHNDNASGSAVGSLHRTWINVKTALSQDNDEALLEECLRGDKASIEDYEEFLNNNKEIPDNLRSTITQQVQDIKNTLDSVSRLEDVH